MQGVVQPGDHPGRVAERRMRGNVPDPFAVEVDFPLVAQALDVLIARHRPGLAARVARRRVIGTGCHCRAPPPARMWPPRSDRYVATTSGTTLQSIRYVP